MLIRFEKPEMDKYFFEKEHAFSDKRRLRTRPLKIFCIVGTIVLLLFFFIVDGFFAPERLSEQEQTKPQAPVTALQSRAQSNSGTSSFYEPTPVFSRRAEPRQLTAPQLVPRDKTRGENHGDLPMGTTLPAKLVNTVLSSHSDSPVIAEIIQDAYFENTPIVPAGSRAIGAGSLDPTTQRLKVRFHTFVYPDGSQHSVNAVALLPDGSAGLAGHYHSGTVSRTSGKFLSNFVGGLAHGLKDRKAEGQAGLTHEPGSLKNGLLNGVATSALENASSYAEDLKNPESYLEVQSGTTFLLYVEKEYTP